MKYIVLLAFVVSLLPTELLSQSKLSVKNGSFGYKYFIDMRKVEKEDFVNELNTQYSKEEISRFNSGRSISDFGKVIGTVSSFIFGYQIGNEISRGESNSTVFIVSGAGTILGLVIDYTGVKKMNRILNSKSGGVSLNLSLEATGPAYGIKYTF